MKFQLKDIFKRNKVTVENYLFMTALQVLNSLFYLLIFPYLIKTLGQENYGYYVFGMSIASYFITLVGFGFDLPALKEIAKNQTNHSIKKYVISCVFISKIYLEVISLFIFSLLLLFVPELRKNWELYFILFGNTLVNILFPVWFFQGIQKMRIVTFIQLAYKLLSLPFIFLFVVKPDDVLIFSIIITLFNLLGGLSATYIIVINQKINIEWVKFNELLVWYKSALPFFWSNAGAAVKQQSTTVLIGSFFNMSDVALYDLANKIILIPSILFGSINSALFPKIINDGRKHIIKKVFHFETLAALLVILMVIFFGKWGVVFLGGKKMAEAHTISIVLSFGVLTLLLVGAYINFIFVPLEKYYLVAQNQVVALINYICLTILGLYLYDNIISIAIAWSLAGLFEIFYCNILIRRHKLL